jgi:REP element-mobilizing transposase RayT
MKYRPDEHNRRSIRLTGYDYSQAGAYFVTICIQNQKSLLGEIIDGEIQLNDAGRMIRTTWDGLPNSFPFAETHQFIVMPNHIHGIIILAGDYTGEHKVHAYRADQPRGTLPSTIGRIIQAFKSITTNEYIAGVRQNSWKPFQGRLWQRNYYEHVIRDENELNHIREYIVCNPANWPEDRENPDSPKYQVDDAPWE